MVLTPIELVLIVGPTVGITFASNFLLFRYIAGTINQGIVGGIGNVVSQAKKTAQDAAPEVLDPNDPKAKFREMGKQSGEARALSSLMGELENESGDPNDIVDSMISKNPKIKKLAEKYPWAVPIAKNYLASMGKGEKNPAGLPGKTLNTGKYWTS